MLSLSQQPNHDRYFRNSFVHNEFIRPETWGDEACAPLVQLVDTLLALGTRPAGSGGKGDGGEEGGDTASSTAQLAHAWLSSWSPLETHQHGDLNLDNILIDARGSVWIIDFAKVHQPGVRTDHLIRKSSHSNRHRFGSRFRRCSRRCCCSALQLLTHCRCSYPY